jgi:hypothetical protein
LNVRALMARRTKNMHWVNLDTVITDRKHENTLTEGQQLDNDESTLIRDQTRLSSWLHTIGESLLIVKRKEAKDGTGDYFVLNRPSIGLFEKIKDALGSNENPYQYDICTINEPLAVEGVPSFAKSTQKTVAIHRKALKKLKRPLIHTVLLFIVIMLAIGYILRLLYRLWF